MSNPDLPPSEQPKLSPLAQTFQAIGHTAFKLGGDRPVMELDRRMWQAAANLTTSEYARARLVRLRWIGKTR